jgi:hypothetical protein
LAVAPALDASAPPSEPASAEPPAPAARSFLQPSGIDTWYVRDVWVVETPPSAVYLLAHFSEPPGPQCEAQLLAHAKGLGANRLFIDRTQDCAGAAYMVRTEALATPSTGTLRTGAGPMHSEDVAAWVRARWKRPALLSAEEAERLCVVVQFSVSPLRRVWNVRGQPIESSGNRTFDDSVKAALESAIDEHATVPAPRRDLVGEYVDYRVEVSGGATCRHR